MKVWMERTSSWQVYVYIHISICVSMYVWKHRQGGEINSLRHLWKRDGETSDSQILVLNIYSPCHTGGNNLEGLSKSVTIFTLGENHDLDCLPIDKIAIFLCARAYVHKNMYIYACPIKTLSWIMPWFNKLNYCTIDYIVLRKSGKV